MPYITNYQAKEYVDNSSVEEIASYFDQTFIRNELRSFYTLDNTIYALGLGYQYEHLDRTFFSINPSFHSPYIFLQADHHFNEKKM